MKTYLIASPRGVKEYGRYYKLIFEELKKLGLTHVDDQIVSTSYDEFVHKMKKGQSEYSRLYEREIEDVKKADVCIFEASVQSAGVGFLVKQALENGKPTIVLYYKKNVPFFLAGIKHEKLITREYQNKNIKKVLKEALEVARERRDKRFNFFISPKLLEYLEKTSKKMGVTKSKLIRDLIINHMKY